MNDAISIEVVIEWLKAKDIIKLSSQEETARRELKVLQFAKPQESTNCVLNKIMAEIKSKAESGQWSEPVKYGMLKAIAIIDKYCKSLE